MNRIANVLLEVDDWPGLATELDITAGEQNAIRGNCRRAAVQMWQSATEDVWFRPTVIPLVWRWESWWRI